MNHTALTTPAGTPNLVNPTHEPCPFTITFPSIEVALAELGQKVFGATIVIAERPAPPPTPSVEAEYQRLGLADMDHAIIKAQLERDEAATEVTTLRDEVKRLADMLDKCQRYTHTQLVEIRQWETRFEQEQMCHAACGVIAMADTRGSATKARDGMHPDYCSASVKDVIRRVDECIELREEVKSLREALAKLETAHPEKDVSAALAPAPTYRLLEVGEVLLNTDEFNYANGGWDASQEAGYKVSPSSVGRYRRKITPA